MAVTNNEEKQPSQALQALTAAALVLPGLTVAPVSIAEDNEASFQYAHYQEGERDVFISGDDYDPIEIQTLYSTAKVSLSDRLTAAFSYTQDTWSGATPFSTTPVVVDSALNTPENSEYVGNKTYSKNGIISGASPITSGNVYLTPNYEPLQIVKLSKKNKKAVTKKADQLVHIIATASPETRRQGNFSLSYEWDKFELDVAGGLSLERDFESHYGNVAGHWDFNQKSTRLSLGLNYAHNETSAILDADALPYIDTAAFDSQIKTQGDTETLTGTRHDFGINFGLNQVLTKNSLVDVSMAYKHSTGYMENPYKAVQVIFADINRLGFDPNFPNAIQGDTQSFLEQRPNKRNQLTFNTGYVHYVEPLEAAAHFNYSFYIDDWGINAHTFEFDWRQAFKSGWMVTPRVRYYSQSQADFYTPYVISKQAKEVVSFNEETFEIESVFFNPQLLPNNFSSDHRLSGYGALSGGVTISKQFSKGIRLEAGFEYYTHAGDLQLGGGGEGAYADFDSYTVNAALSVNLSHLFAGTKTEVQHSHSHQHQQHKAHAPAGVMLDHFMDKAGTWMLGYNYRYSLKDGDMLQGSRVANDAAIVNQGCGQKDLRCRFKPADMTMHMHMFNIMYAPTDWLNLMLMPQFMDMDMQLVDLQGAPPAPANSHDHGSGGHSTGGLGDTSLHALLKLFSNDNHHLHLGLGISAPTGDIDLELRRGGREDGGLIHYGMQLGSGTWDFKPSLTYTGQLDQWSWGAQFNGTVRLESVNDSGFAFGDEFQTTAWGSYQFLDWLSASVRGIYTLQDDIRGSFQQNFEPSGSMDYGRNYGGEYWDVGFGVNAMVVSGDFAGNRLAVEWIQPVADRVHGFQRERTGALAFTWGLSF